MAVTLIRQDTTAFDVFTQTPESCLISELVEKDKDEVLDFLAARPIHTVFLTSLICDNGLASPHNRGSFYACRGRAGQLEGVALIGHATIIEARTDNALATFARMTRNCLNAQLIRGERKTIDRLWKHYAHPAAEPRLICRELLMEQRQPALIVEPVDELRPATLDHLEQILRVNASLAFQQARVSPLHDDPGGFRQRTARRVEQGRIWVWVRDGRLIFKADVIAETPQAIYLEGVHVHPEERLRGYGVRCMTQLGSILLTRTEAICLTLNEENRKALSFYSKAGYRFHSHYQTIYLK